MYKKSKYNIFTEFEDDYLVTNTLNKTVVVLLKDEFNEYKKLPDNNILPTKFSTALFDCGLLVENNLDEVKELILKHKEAKNNTDLLNVTIVPSFNCNFACSYCYQQDMPKGILNKKDSDKIIRFIENKITLTNPKKVHIECYGGEPLLCIKNIEYINSTIIKKYSTNLEITSSIATNLYLLDDKMLELLIKLHVNRIETTLTGTEEYHNKLRFLKNKKGTFDKVFNNIKKVSTFIPTIINVNVSYDNLENMDDLIDLVCQELKGKKIYLNFNKIGFYKQMKNDVHEIKDFSDIKIKLLNKCILKNINICDDTNFDKEYIFCPQQHINSFSIDFRGFVYKCAEYFEESDCIGQIDNDGNICEIKAKESMPKKCLNCEILPYCNFGCTAKRNNNERCPEEKDKMGEYLKIFYLKQQLDNTKGGELNESNS